MKKLYIITGANGHLGSTIIRYLIKLKNTYIRGLVLNKENLIIAKNIEYMVGNIVDKTSLLPLFNEKEKFDKVIVIHTAGIIDISGDINEKIYNVNVNGTKNIVDMSLENNVDKFLYTSSVHAIPENKNNAKITEIDKFSADKVIGGYAKTKAIATEYVLEAVKKGLNAIVVHPSGIIGPYDNSGNFLVQLVNNYIQGKLPACVKGGYDFVDVRDVAKGCILAINKGKIGRTYILSNKYYSITEIIEMIKKIKKCKKMPVLPMWLAKFAIPFIKIYAKIKKVRPLYTEYSLYTLTSNSNFSHERATKELGYKPRDMYVTLKDTINWIENKKAFCITKIK